MQLMITQQKLEEDSSADIFVINLNTTFVN